MYTELCFKVKKMYMKLGTGQWWYNLQIKAWIMLAHTEIILNTMGVSNLPRVFTYLQQHGSKP
jgi:hypothetical protein